MDIFDSPLGFTNSAADGNVYVLQNRSDFAVLTLYVDDTLIAANSLPLLHSIKRQLNSRFLLSDLGEVHHLLSLQVTRNLDHGWFRITQALYITQKLAEFGFLASKPVSTPLAPGTHLSAADCPSSSAETALIAAFPYANAVGSLKWASLCTRPDLSFTVNVLAQCMHNPGDAHIRACKHVFRYLRGTIDHYLEYRRTSTVPRPLYGFSDADWAGEVDQRRSTSGYVFLLSTGAISWSSTRQKTTALSSTEAEYVAMATAASELLWLRQLLHDLHCTDTLQTPTRVYCDNQSALALVTTTRFHSRTKHISIRYHFIRQLVAQHKADFTYCPTEKMHADIFTKSLTGPKLAQHLPMLGLLGGETPRS